MTLYLDLEKYKIRCILWMDSHQILSPKGGLFITLGNSGKANQYPTPNHQKRH
ncbi:hypothetical protein GKODMF_07595 [Candidatus Electrothrix gigas]